MNEDRRRARLLVPSVVTECSAAEYLVSRLLVIDFDTEVAMSGMAGFLENSTGLCLGETIEAPRRIHAPQTAEILVRVQNIMGRYGVAPASLRADFANVRQYAVRSFSELHGPQLDEVVEK